MEAVPELSPLTQPLLFRSHIDLPSGLDSYTGRPKQWSQTFLQFPSSSDIPFPWRSWEEVLFWQKIRWPSILESRNRIPSSFDEEEKVPSSIVSEWKAGDGVPDSYSLQYRSEKETIPIWVRMFSRDTKGDWKRPFTRLSGWVSTNGYSIYISPFKIECNLLPIICQFSKESSGKKWHALLITQISEDDDTDFTGFSIHLASV